MECNKDEAIRAKEIAEKKFSAKDTAGAKRFALKAQSIYPSLDGISQMVATLDVHLAAEATVYGEKDWYAILSVNSSADEEMVKKQYRKFALMLHPDKNKSIGAEAAFKLILEAWSVLSDKTRRMAYDRKRGVKVNRQTTSQRYGSSNGFHHPAKSTTSSFRNPAKNAASSFHHPAKDAASSFHHPAKSAASGFHHPAKSAASGFHHPAKNVASGFHHPAKSAASSFKTQKNNPAHTASSVVPPQTVPADIPTSFWTICSHCKMQYEYVRKYLNAHLLCPNCKNPFLAVETGNPIDGSNSSIPCVPPWRQQSNHSKTGYEHGKFSSSSKSRESAAFSNLASHNSFAGGAPGRTNSDTSGGWSNVSFSGSVSDNQEHPILGKAERPAKKRKGICDDGVRDLGTGVSKKQSGIFQGNKSTTSCASFLETGSPNSIFGDSGKSKAGYWQINNLSQELSSLDIRNMLMQKAKVVIQKKLDDWSTAAAAKLAEKERASKKQKQKENDGEKETVVLHANAPEEIKMDKSSSHIKQVSGKEASSEDLNDDSVNEDQEPVSIDVPDPDFHDFDKDRSERSFGPDQVWASYDDEDGMPRFYILIQKVLSSKPFKIRMSFLNSRSNSEFGPLNWVGMGFAKTSGDFRVGRYETVDSINVFSHKVRSEKGPRGVIQILPRKCDIWAIYRNWSPNWNEETPDDVMYKYDMVEVLDDYNEQQGVPVTPLVKVPGFKTVFRRHEDPEKVQVIPREEMFRFSHQVPSFLLTGEESENVPKGCLELDPAATPLELLQVMTEAKEEKVVETPENQPVS